MGGPLVKLKHMSSTYPILSNASRYVTPPPVKQQITFPIDPFPFHFFPYKTPIFLAAL
jgi:hypothetical protein